MEMSSVSKNVHLTEMDGFEFENLCKVIFEQLNYGEVELQPPVGDGGKDILIFTPNGKIVVECKHQPNTSIGRPVIQKLHSAVITENATKGIVITTGRFSRQAIEHAANLSPAIELVDIAMFRDMASRAGIHLILEDGSAPIHTYDILTDNSVSDVVSSHLSNNIISHPAVIKDVFSIKDLDASLHPIYKITYDIDATFATTVGVVHREHSSGQLFMDGGNGDNIHPVIANYFSSTSNDKKILWEDVATKSNIKDRPFQLPISSVKDMALSAIIEKHTTTVKYQGRNNQSYSKICAPTRNDIFIGDISQEYIPVYQTDCLLAGRDQKVIFASNGALPICIMSDTTATCPLGRSHAKSGRSLCNECGLITCTKSSIVKRRRHALQCEICGMTLCPYCASYVRKLLFFKRVVCDTCSNNFSGKRVKKLIRQDKLGYNKLVK